MELGLRPGIFAVDDGDVLLRRQSRRLLLHRLPQRQLWPLQDDNGFRGIMCHLRPSSPLGQGFLPLCYYQVVGKTFRRL